MEHKSEDSPEQKPQDQKEPLADKIKVYFKNLLDFSFYNNRGFEWG